MDIVVRLGTPFEILNIVIEFISVNMVYNIISIWVIKKRHRNQPMYLDLL